MNSLYTFCHRHGSRLPMLLLAGILLLAQTAWAAGTPVYSAGGAVQNRSCRTFINLLGVKVTECFGEVDNIGNAADGDFNSAATIQVPLISLSGNSIQLRMNMAKQVPKNYRAGVVVRRKGNLLGLLNLNLDLAGRLVLRTLQDGVQQEEILVSSNLVKAVLGDENGATRLEFTATKQFNQIELQANSFIAVSYDLDVFYAYGVDANIIEKTDGLVSRFPDASNVNYSTEVVDDNNVTLCVNSGVDNPKNAVSSDLTDYATLTTVVGVSCPSTLRVQLEGTAPAGYEAGFVLGSGGLLDASVLNSLRLTTYLGSMKQEQAVGIGALRLQVLPGGQSVVRFRTTKPFNRVELQRSSLLGALDNLRIYYGFGVTPSTFRDQDPYLSAFDNTANNFQVGDTTGIISNPALAADMELTNNFASVGSLVGIGTAPRLKLRLDNSGMAGNRAGVVLGRATGLLDVGLLDGVRIRTYSGATGGTLVETASGGSLLNLELLPGGRQEVFFLTTQNFDWVEVELPVGVDLLSGTNIYYAFADDQPIGFPTLIVPSTPLPVQLTAFGARARGLAVEVSWETAAEINSSYFEVERSAEAGRGFVAVGRQQAAGNSSSQKRYAFTDEAAAQLAAGTLYYRLHQVDLDGTETYSTVAVVTRWASVAPLALYPNPAPAGSTLRLSLPALREGGRYELVLYSMQGVLVGQLPIGAQGQADAVQLPALAAGMYQAVVNDAAGQPVGRQRLVIGATSR